MSLCNNSCIFIILCLIITVLVFVECNNPKMMKIFNLTTLDSDSVPICDLSICHLPECYCSEDGTKIYLKRNSKNGMVNTVKVAVDDFMLIEGKASDAVKLAPKAIVNGVHFIEEKTSQALGHAEEAMAYEFQQIESKSYGCHCADYSCGCCVHLDFPKIHLNDTGCVNLTYLVKDYGISFTVTIDNLTIYNETISVHDPPPICFSAPVLEKFADLCVHFYDLDATRTKLHGCVDIEARLHHIVVGRYKVGCFNIGRSTLGLWKKYHMLLIEKIRSKQKN